MFLNTFSPTRSPNPEAGSWVVAPHQGRPFGTAQKRAWLLPPPPERNSRLRRASRASRTAKRAARAVARA